MLLRLPSTLVLERDRPTNRVFERILNSTWLDTYQVGILTTVLRTFKKITLLRTVRPVSNCTVP